VGKSFVFSCRAVFSSSYPLGKDDDGETISEGSMTSAVKEEMCSEKFPRIAIARDSGRFKRGDASFRRPPLFSSSATAFSCGLTLPPSATYSNSDATPFF